MEVTPREIVICRTEDGSSHYEHWLAGLDIGTRARVRIRIDRLQAGNFGDVQPVGEGVSELRLDFGAGYRIYFGQQRIRVCLIGGGAKRTQAKDILRALEFWRTYE